MQTITAEELKNRIDSKNAPVIIDVREQYEFDEYNINGILIPLGDLKESLDKLEKYKNSEIVIHCRSGARSAAATDFLTKQGFSNVKNLIGGMLDWQSKFP
ncbi:MAG: rhodanese-like domain-containing protein [Bacteroidetes bacterium]|nr:rhodanese-like domain-containing protein [Bacteroidota bacterium]